MLCAQAQPSVWVPDLGNGRYRNPVIHADYSDPDAVRVGDDYYMTASSFTQVPGLPILHSRDLVHWELIGHGLPRLVPEEYYRVVRHGGGVWAPSIRYHNNEFYIYYPDPDFGIYLVKAKNIRGPWSEPVLVEAGKGLIDPCPLWDDDGKVYLVHAYAGSRAGIKSLIVVKELNKEGTKVTGAPVMVYDGHEKDPTIEGPKFYKRNGWYYIFAPAGGVSTGWQTVLRSRKIYGPYERKVVMDQGNSPVNGPHQGAWVTTPTAENWFLHFQDKAAYGRVVHLQPVQWVNDWPVIGNDPDGDGKGEPVTEYHKPGTDRQYARMAPAEGDEFNEPVLGSQWQWQANPMEGWAYPTSQGFLRLFSLYRPDSVKSIWDLPGILGQKFPAPGFTATVKLKFHPKFSHERIGLVVFGSAYAAVQVEKRDDKLLAVYTENNKAEKGGAEEQTVLGEISGADCYLQVTVEEGGLCRFAAGTDPKRLVKSEKTFRAEPGKWVGARLGLFCLRNNMTNDAGYADLYWIHIDK